MNNNLNYIPQLGEGGWFNDWINGKSATDFVSQKITDSLGGGLVGKGAGMVGTLGAYSIPILGNILAADDLRALIIKMRKAKKLNLTDWGNLALNTLFVLPVVGNAAKLLGGTGKTANTIFKAATKGKSTMGTIGKNAVIMGGSLGSNLFMPGNAEFKKMYKGLNLTEAEIAQLKELEKLQKKQMAAKNGLLKALQMGAKPLTISNTPISTLESPEELLKLIQASYV